MATKTKDAPTLGETTALATSAQGTALAPAEDYGTDYGAGMEDISSNEITVPFYRILQALSPQCEQGNALYMEHARPGMILNTVTGDLIDGKEGFAVIAVNRGHQFLEYVPRDAGGGFQGIWDPADPRIAPLQAAQGLYTKLRLENGNDLVEAYNLFVLAIHPDGMIYNGVVSFSSTQIKKYKSFMTRLLGASNLLPRRPPMFAFKWRFGTQPEKNKKGSFNGWRIALHGDDALMPANSDLYRKAREFYEMLRSGEVKPDYAADVASGGSDSETEEDIPF